MDTFVESGAFFDVAVIGAGPAGATAARIAAEMGSKVLLVDRYSFPRNKLCGGGLTPRSVELIPDSVRSTIEGRAYSAALTYSGYLSKRRRSSRDFMALVQRRKFDYALVEAAVRSGATFLQSLTLREIKEVGSQVTLAFNGQQALKVGARIVIGADGVNGMCRQYVGVIPEIIDLALETELARIDNDSEWNNAVWIDWGRLRGGYAWVFPKGDRLAVGVIARKGKPRETKQYLERWMKQLGLYEREVLDFSGHLTHVRRTDSPLRRGRVLVAGDAAGLLEPCSREGISFALRSGALAGHAAAQASATASSCERETLLNSYGDRVIDTLGREQRRGRILRQMFERMPLLVHIAVGWSPIWSAKAIQTALRLTKSTAATYEELANRR